MTLLPTPTFLQLSLRLVQLHSRQRSWKIKSTPTWTCSCGDMRLFCPQTKAFKELGHRLTSVTLDDSLHQYLLQKISVAVQWGNAASVVGSLPWASKMDDVEIWLLLCSYYCLTILIYFDCFNYLEWKYFWLIKKKKSWIKIFKKIKKKIKKKIFFFTHIFNKLKKWYFKNNSWTGELTHEPIYNRNQIHLGNI